MDFDQPPVVRVSVPADRQLPAREWPMDIPAVAQLQREGLDLDPGVTFLVGENGSGKSTLVEAVAVAFGLSPEGGSVQSAHSTRPSESGLAAALTLRRGLGASRWASCAPRPCTAGTPTSSRPGATSHRASREDRPSTR